MADEHIETHEFFGDGLELRTGVSPQCGGESPQHFECVNFKFDEGQPPMICCCWCHRLTKVI